MDVVVNARHCEVSDRFRSHVEEKLARLEKHDHRIIRVQVEVEKERNPRQHDRAVRVELTALSKGPVIRAEAAAEDKMGALDLAVDKMAAQMRRAADRRRVHHGRHTPVSVGEALADVATPEAGTADDGVVIERMGDGAHRLAEADGIGQGLVHQSGAGGIVHHGCGNIERSNQWIEGRCRAVHHKRFVELVEVDWRAVRELDVDHRTH